MQLKTDVRQPICMAPQLTETQQAELVKEQVDLDALEELISASVQHGRDG